jgi:hypothetical protein
MNAYYEQAKERLLREEKTVTGQKEKAIAKAVRIALANFCLQDAEFAEAVANGGSFQNCLSEVVRGVGNSISDADAFRKAAQFYFKGCDVRMVLEIDVCPNRVQEPSSVLRAPSPKVEGHDTSEKSRPIRLEMIDLEAYL